MTAEDTKAAARALLGLSSTASRAVRSLQVPTPVAQSVLSEEQEGILAQSHHRMVITALAGAGKSRVMAEFVRRASHRPWNYLAFNKSLAQEASISMPRASCKTIHSLAFSAFGKPYSEKCNMPWTAEVVSDWCNLPQVSSRNTALLVVAVVQRFMASRDYEISASHIPLSYWQKYREETQGSVETEVVVEWARLLWRGMVDTASPVPMDLDGVVKLMHLSKWIPLLPKNAGFLVDEAQDLTPCIRSWLDTLPYQVIRAGDPHQSIYGWRMQGLTSPWVAPGEREMWLCGSWRFGPDVADLVNPLLRYLGCTHTLVGLAPHTSISSGEDSAAVLLARTRSGLANEVARRIKSGAKIDYSLAPWILMQSRELDMDVSNEECWSDEGQELGPDIFSSAQSLHGQKVMTAHASKGASFRSVVLAEDFVWPPSTSRDDKEEARILYVALTRAQERLSLPESLLLSLRSMKVEGTSSSLSADDSGF